MTLIKRGFTLVELLVVVAMISLILGALTTSVSAAQERARIQKATAEVKAITQAVLAYENSAKDYELEAYASPRDCDKSTLGFLLGNGSGSTETGNKLPVVLMAALSGGGKIMDPWGRPYQIRIKDGQVNLNSGMLKSTLQTGYTLPNFYRLSEGERK